MKKRVIALIFIFVFVNLILGIYGENLNSTTKADISLNIKWNSEEIINGGEFNIEISAINLKSKNYDVKVFISDNEKIISQTYDGNKWISSNNYVKNFFTGPDEKNGEIKIRIKSDYKDFSGNAQIGFRLRESGSSSYKEAKDNIIVLGAVDNLNEDNNSDTPSSNPETNNEVIEVSKIKTSDNSITAVNPVKTVKSLTSSAAISAEKTVVTGEVIKLGKVNNKIEDIKIQNDIVYESKNELIKRYSVFGFAFLCLVLVVLLIFKLI